MGDAQSLFGKIWDRQQVHDLGGELAFTDASARGQLHRRCAQ